MNDDEPEYYSLFQGNISSSSESESEVDLSGRGTKNEQPTNIYSQNYSLRMEIDNSNTDEMEFQAVQQLEFSKLDPLFENENLGMIQHFDEDDDENDIDLSRNIDEKCNQCGQNVNFNKWCRECNEIHFRELFDSWSTENRELDLLIQQAQLNSTRSIEVIEFISFEQFKDIELIEEGEKFDLYTAVWKDGPIEGWNALENRWNRRPSLRITLKQFKHAEEKFEIAYDELHSYYETTHAIGMSGPDSVIRCFGVSRHPSTNDHIIIYEYAQQWTVHEYIGQNFSTISWHQKLFLLNHIARDIANIHQLSYVYALIFGKGETKSSFEEISAQGISAKIAIMSLKSDNQILNKALAQIVKEEPKIENEADNLESE
ncbi:2859_t:CDS:2, partial [Ambispora leptoticha]